MEITPSIIGLILLGCLATIALPYFLRQKDEELNGKADSEHLDRLEKEREKSRSEREEGMRNWVKTTIMEFVGASIKELKKDFKDALAEMEKRSDERYQVILSLVKQINHERLSRKAEYEATIGICNDALTRVKETYEFIENLKKHEQKR